MVVGVLYILSYAQTTSAARLQTYDVPNNRVRLLPLRRSHACMYVFVCACDVSLSVQVSTVAVFDANLAVSQLCQDWQ